MLAHAHIDDASWGDVKFFRDSITPSEGVLGLSKGKNDIDGFDGERHGGVNHDFRRCATSGFAVCLIPEMTWVSGMAGRENQIGDMESHPEDVTKGRSVADDFDLLDSQDVAWMERVASGDEKAFRLLVERHQHAVVGMVARMLGDVHEAEDIAQQVFVRVWQAAAKWRPEAKFTTWLFTIVRNQVFNESRRRSRKRETSLEERMENHPEMMQSGESLAPDEVMEKGEWHRKIDAAIASLPEQQRMAVLLRTFEGKDYEEIAQIMGTSVSSLKSLLFRARGTLRKMLGEEQ